MSVRKAKNENILEVKTEGEAESKPEDPQAIEDIRTVGAFANETLIDGEIENENAEK